MEGTSKAFKYFVDYTYPDIENKSASLRKTIFDYNKGKIISEERMKSLLIEYGFSIKKETTWAIPK